MFVTFLLVLLYSFFFYLFLLVLFFFFLIFFLSSSSSSSSSSSPSSSSASSCSCFAYFSSSSNLLHPAGVHDARVPEAAVWRQADPDVHGGAGAARLHLYQDLGELLLKVPIYIFTKISVSDDPVYIFTKISVSDDPSTSSPRSR